MGKLPQTTLLRRHLGFGDSPGLEPSFDTPPTSAVLFFIERAPHSPNGAKCRLATCPGQISPGEYRVALTPGMSGLVSVQAKVSDLYHVRCFEEIADLSDPDYLDRIQPLTRFNWPLRNRRITSVFDCRNFCCGGVERLVDEWKARRGKWIDEQDGVKEEKKSPAWENLMERAGSSTFTFQMIPGLTSDAQLLLGHSLAPFESDGEGDTTEWNLFDSYLDAQDDEESHYEKHNLSSILQRWKHDEKLVASADHNLTDTEKQAKVALGEKAARAIKRLSVVYM